MLFFIKIERSVLIASVFSFKDMLEKTKMQKTQKFSAFLCYRKNPVECRAFAAFFLTNAILFTLTRTLTLFTILTLYLHLHLHCTCHTYTIYTSTTYKLTTTNYPHTLRFYHPTFRVTGTVHKFPLQCNFLRTKKAAVIIN